MAKLIAKFELEKVQVEFLNYEDNRGNISNCILIFDGQHFQISSDTATYHRMLDYFREKYPNEMADVYDAAPRFR